MSCPSQYRRTASGETWLDLPGGESYRIAWSGRGSLTAGYRSPSATALVMRDCESHSRRKPEPFEFGWQERPIVDPHAIELEHAIG